jgi:hypothetical protein
MTADSILENLQELSVTAEQRFVSYGRPAGW